MVAKAVVRNKNHCGVCAWGFAIVKLSISALNLIKTLFNIQERSGVSFYLCKLQALEILPGLLEAGVKLEQQVPVVVVNVPLRMTVCFWALDLLI